MTRLLSKPTARPPSEFGRSSHSSCTTTYTPVAAVGWTTEPNSTDDRSLRFRNKSGIHYSIIPADLAAHLFKITLRVEKPDPAGQIFRLPAWIPGSYMLRDFARHIVQISASCNAKKVKLIKLDKDSWQAEPVAGGLILEYQVYAWDLSVRGAYLDQTRGFYNGTSVFLRVVGQEKFRHVVEIHRPIDPTCKKWRVATALSPLKAKRYAFGSYVAENYDELIDHPVEMGEFTLAGFTAHGVPHDVVVSGNIPSIDIERITRDLAKICATQIAFFEPKTKRAPMNRYVFLVLAVGEGYGGLEHRCSTALICSRNNLPVLGKHDMSEAYIHFLGLCSHEYFHTWNVKRIKPAEFVEYDLQRENYTSLLWLFEGITSYYDDLMLLRSGLIDETKYVELVSKTLNGVLRGAGRHKQSVSESSFDAWAKYYRQDENSPNAIVSYYTKGSLIALALDLTIRQKTAGNKSLDDLMRMLWQQFGRDFYTEKQQQGVDESQVEKLVSQLCGIDMHSFFDRYIRGTHDLPLSTLLVEFGIALVDQAKHKKPGLGVKLVQDGSDCKLANVFAGSAAHHAGLSAGDVIVAIDGIRVTASDVRTNLSRLLERYSIGTEIVVQAFRRDELMQFKVRLQADDIPMWALQVQGKAKKTSKLKLNQKNWPD